MKQVILDFGTDHAWQMDAFFGNGTGWGINEQEKEAWMAGPNMTACVWSDAKTNTYLKGCATGGPDHASVLSQPAAGETPCPAFATVAEAKAACDSTEYADCMGVTALHGKFELRAGSFAIAVPALDEETSYLIQNPHACKVTAPVSAPAKDLPADPVYLARAKAAYGAVARADGPTARWFYQGWALHVAGSGMSPPGPKTLSRVHGFSQAAPPGNFILLDMAVSGQWKEWKGTWGIPFIWTSLPDFGGDMYMHGDLREVNEIPFEAPPLSPAPAGYNTATQAVGVGYTPEGLDQNPAYYELLQEAAFKVAPEANLTQWLVDRAHRRYGLTSGAVDADVASAWADLGAGPYINDGPVHDGTGVGQMPSKGAPPWMGFDNSSMPKPVACLEWRCAVLGLFCP
jgi:hypothetical protein